MIFDRTIQDVNQAISIRNEKIKNNVDITEEELEILERGFVTHNTLNRIESKQDEIKEKLIRAGYRNCDINNKEWSLGDVFDSEELDRIVNNNSRLRKAFFVKPNTPLDAVSRYDYDEFNRLERILTDLENILSTISYEECGAYVCGGN